jgi:hypothetical protein
VSATTTIVASVVIAQNTLIASVHLMTVALAKNIASMAKTQVNLEKIQDSTMVSRPAAKMANVMANEKAIAINVAISQIAITTETATAILDQTTIAAINLVRKIANVMAVITKGASVRMLANAVHATTLNRTHQHREYRKRQFCLSQPSA